MKNKQNLTNKIYALMAVLCLAVLLVPLLRLTCFSVPWYDDYNYGRFAKTVMDINGYHLGNALKGAAECIRISWYAWQGTYSSIFFMAMMPAIWGEQYYFLGPAFLILMLTISVMCFVYTICRKVLDAQSSTALGISAVTGAMAVTLIHTSQAGFYWYNGGVHYVGMHSFALLLVTAAVRLFFAEKKGTRLWWMSVTALLSVVVAGGNYVTALQAFLVLGTILFLAVLKRRNWYFYLIPVALYGGCFFLNVSAPGNAKRALSYVGWGMSPVKAVLYSFVEGGKNAWNFTGLMTIAFLLAMVPLLLGAVSHCSFSFPLPGLVSLWSVCLYATGFTPSLYSMGHGGLGRTLNAVKLTWQLLLVLNLAYWMGYGYRKWQYSRQRDFFGWWFYPLVAVVFLAAFVTEPNKAGSFSPYGAYYYVHSGEADNFHREYLERVEILKSDEENVVLEPFKWHPWMICMGDLSENPSEESNVAVANWYDKEQVICREP